MTTHFELYRYDLPLVRPVRVAGQTIERRSGLILRVACDSEPWACGDIAPLPGLNSESLDEARREVVLWLKRFPEFGFDGVSKVTRKRFRFCPSVRFGIDSCHAALRRVAARTGETPPVKKRDSVLVNGLLVGDGDELVHRARNLAQDGYRAAKLKVGSQTVPETIATIRLVREALGTGVALRLDANRAWDLDTARRVAKGVEPGAIEYIEEPLADPRNLHRFYMQTGMPVALDETLAEQDKPRPFLEDKTWLKAVVLKPTVLGARTGAWWAAASRYGITPVVSAAFESGVGIAALAHLAAEFTPEGVPVGLDTYSWLAADVLKQRLTIRGGRLNLDEVDTCLDTMDVDAMERLHDVQY